MKTKEEYNKEPVYYCKDCLSLHILVEDDYSYCAKCGSLDIKETDIDTWSSMYAKRYKHFFSKKK